MPTTSIRAQHSPITKTFLTEQFKLFKRFDDIWNDKFLDAMFISYDGPATAFLDEEAEEWIQTLGLRVLYISSAIKMPEVKTLRILEIDSGPPAGPYFTKAAVPENPNEKQSTIEIFDVYRLEKDPYEAFVFGALPLADGGWRTTNITLGKDSVQYIPIPSRMAILTKGLPLSGTRFALKDIFDAEGLPTAAGSTAYGKIVPTPRKTAESVEKLLALGATLVGKTRTSQFAHGAQPWEYRDIPYSWNPRADGYLTASASSSGSACAIAGYDWLDFAVGSDTRGSVRKPAALVGAYGMRPTHGSMDLSGVVPLSEEMDTAGFFARDPRLFSEIGTRWFAESPVRIKRTTIRFPRKLIYPTDHFPVRHPDAQKIYDSFVSSLEKHLKMTKVPMDFTEALRPYLPNGNFTEFQLYSNTLAEYRSWHSVGKPLVEKYRRLFNKAPKFDPKTRQMFKRARNLTESEFDEAVALRRQFKEDVAKELIKADTKSCSESVFIYDAGTGGHPSYRGKKYNQLPGATQFLLSSIEVDAKPSQFFTYVGSMAGLPEITVPIGQVAYFSEVSKQWEMLPVTAQLAAHPGCDDMLMEMVQKLAEAGVIIPAKAGRETF
ncbi:amidase signature domain-containing protein [Collybia nuda]|uniref:Amidase signature domain-containing protein n=1 Tax=Collybia nuda TaxID=64659 RepID=A0A9P6CDC6_9AGAR|nr:amidase signature domain-containing protein [Collybia nuda]